MLALYRIYQLLVMLPLMAAVTIVAAVITATGSIAFGGRWWGYYPAKIWARIMCRLTLVSVEVSMYCVKTLGKYGSKGQL